MNNEWKNYKMICVTPCFCAGADQRKAEIRVASIRGELRWWYRVLGGSPEGEARLFGGVAGKATASSVAIRVGAVKRGPPWKPDLNSEFSTNKKGGWIWHFATVSDETKGERWVAKNPEDGHLPPDTSFTLGIRENDTASKDPLWRDALSCFLLLGSIGMRATRGMGALQAENPLRPLSEIEKLLTSRGFIFKARKVENWEDGIFQAERYFKENLRKTFGAGQQGNKPSPLGSAKPRQTSAVRMRPLKDGDDWLLAAFEAPHDRVLGPESRKATQSQVLKAVDFTQPPPPLKNAGGGKRYGRR